MNVIAQEVYGANVQAHLALVLVRNPWQLPHVNLVSA